MNVQPLNNSDISMKGRPIKNWKAVKERIKQKMLDMSPSYTAKQDKKSAENWNKFSNWVAKPVENRGIMGVTALLTQPFIDGCNMKVDKDTRKMAFINRVAVILSGTAVGMFVVRGPVYKAIEKMTDVNGNSKHSKSLLPKKFIKEISENEKYLKNYRSALAIAIILGINSITNIALDAPLTIALTNLMQKAFLKDKKAVLPEEGKNG